MADIEISLGELELAGDERRSAPTEFRILRRGESRTRRKGVVVFDSRAAELVLAEWQAEGRPLAIDYEHAQMPGSGAAPSEKRSAGWFRPEERDGELWAADVEWTPAGRAAVESKEFRFTSLWGDGEPIEGGRARLRRLCNVALTNSPAVLGSVPLVNSEGTEEKQMSEKNTLVIALGCSEEAEAVTKIQALGLVMSEAEHVTGKSTAAEVVGALRALKLKAERCDAVELALSEMRTAAEREKRDALIIRLSEAGKLPPTLHDWARSLPLEALIAFGEGAPALVGSEGAEPKEPAPADMLDPEIKRSLAQLGLTDDDYRAAEAAGQL